MKKQFIEIVFVLAALFAAAVTIAAVAASDADSGSVPLGSRPGAYPPPVIVAAPDQFPWWRMPALPEQSNRTKVPPVLVISPYPGPVGR